jgi:hypothetical protein
MSNATIQIFIVNYNSTEEINKNIKLIIDNNNRVENIKITIIDNSQNFFLVEKKYQEYITVEQQNNNINSDLYGKGSLDHSLSLNKYVNTLGTFARITIIMDPDCYLYGSNWIADFSTLCNTKGICIATPWHPKHDAKKINSIAPHFLMFLHDWDVEYDFRPNFDGISNIRSKVSAHGALEKDSLLRLLFRPIKRVLFWGTSKDTGHKLDKCFNKIYWFIPMVNEKQVFWIKNGGKVKKQYKFLLKILRNIDLGQTQYLYTNISETSDETFCFRDTVLKHERRTDRD